MHLQILFHLKKIIDEQSYIFFMKIPCKYMEILFLIGANNICRVSWWCSLLLDTPQTEGCHPLVAKLDQHIQD